MKFKVYIQDLKAEWIPRIQETLRYDLAEEIDNAVASGIPRETAEHEIIDDYINRHNAGWHIEL